MVKIKEKLKKILIEAIEGIANISLDTEDINIEVPKKKEHGDFTTNIAMKLAGELNITAYELGEQIKDKLSLKHNFLDDIKIMGPGFVNFYIKEENLIKDSLNAIKSGEFKKIGLKGEDIKLVMILDNLKNICTLENFRVFMNMYYLGNLYNFSGVNARRIILVKDYEEHLDASYLLSNFKDIELTQDENQLYESINFCHTLNQGLFNEPGKKPLLIEGVKVLKNGFEVYDITFADLLEELGFDRVKYTLCDKAINSEGVIEFTKNDLRNIVYPYSRISSIVNIFKNEGLDIDDLEDFSVECLDGPLEQEIIKKILGFKEAVINAVNQNQPYKFIKYANELYELFYKINASTLYRQLSREKLIALLKLLSSVKIVFKEILTILELPALDKM